MQVLSVIFCCSFEQLNSLSAIVSASAADAAIAITDSSVKCRRPIANMLGPHLVVLGSGLEQWGTQMLQLGRSLATALSLAGKAVMGPPLQFMLAVMQALGQLMLPVWQVS